MNSLRSLTMLAAGTALTAALALCTPAHAAALLNGGGGGGCGGGGGGGGSNLQCDAGGPYKVDCNGGSATVQLDGTGSSGATKWTWSSSCANAMFSDIHSPMPTLTFTTTTSTKCNCNHECSVTLTVGNGKQTKSCSAEVKVKDKQAPVISCPETAKFFCGASTDPSNTGYATATDNCDPNVTVTYQDHIQLHDCPADRFDHVIMRKWKAKDDCGNKAECTQLIDVLKIPVFIDVLPGQCPNVLPSGDCYVPITILGAPDFDVTKVKLDSVRLYGEFCEGGPVKPKQFQLGDVTSPVVAFNNQCDCTTAGPDGQLDLTLKFKRNEIAYALGLCSLPSGSTVTIVITGKLHDCETCKFIGTDCIVVP
jgi:hypothetical protein